MIYSPAHNSQKLARAAAVSAAFLWPAGGGHGKQTSSGGGTAAAAGGAERICGELLSDAAGGDGVLGLEPGSAGPRGAGGGRG